MVVLSDYSSRLIMLRHSLIARDGGQTTNSGLYRFIFLFSLVQSGMFENRVPLKPLLGT